MAVSPDVEGALRKRSVLHLLREVNTATLHLRDQLVKAQDWESLDRLEDHLRLRLLQVEESSAEGRWYAG